MVLAAFSHCVVSERQELLDDIYEKWKADILVMDMWLILQAAFNLPQTLESVRELPGINDACLQMWQYGSLLNKNCGQLLPLCQNIMNFMGQLFHVIRFLNKTIAALLQGSRGLAINAVAA